MDWFTEVANRGSTASGTGAKFDRFLSHIQLTDKQIEDAVSKHTRIRKALHAEFYGTPYTTTTSMLIGSYGKNTAIRPPRDIDLLFILPESARSKYGYWTPNIQSRILQDVKLKLQKNFTTKMSADGPVIYIPFTDSTFSVEVVPAFKKYDGCFEVCYTKDGGSWGIAYPEAEASQLIKSNLKTNGNTIKLIKMIKIWQYVWSVELESFGIEILCQDFLSSYEHASKTSVYHDYMIRDFFKFITNKWTNSVYKPGGYLDSFELGDSWRSKATSALRRAEKAVAFESAGKQADANNEWRMIFGDYFVG